MKHIESMRGLCSVLSGIEETDSEVAAFLYLYGYNDRPDIVNPDASLTDAGVYVKFDAAIAKGILRKVWEEQKENGHPEIAVKAMELWLRLNNLEKETMGKNIQ